MKVLALFFLVIPLFGLAENDMEKSTLVRVGEQAPNFTVKTIEGGEIELGDLRGKVVLINFFATWCQPCLAEMPHLELKVWQQFKDQDFMLIAIGREHTKQDLIKFTNVVNFTFPIGYDPKREIYAKYAGKYIPRNVLIDRSGTIIYQSAGFEEAEFSRMVEVIEKTLKADTLRR